MGADATGLLDSTDRLHWTRAATIRESSAEFAGQDPRAALWSPLPVWDDTSRRWNLFYVAYHAMPGDGTAFKLNMHGRIWRAVSRTPGETGIAGPYDDVGVVMQPGPDSMPWEGLQGTDSFFPWHAGSRWLALYGSAQPSTCRSSIGWSDWRPRHRSEARGRAYRHAALPDRRKSSSRTPSSRRRPGGGWLAVYDTNAADAIGWAWSADGETWLPGHALVVQQTAGEWAKDVRTPLGLIDEGGGRYTVF